MSLLFLLLLLLTGGGWCRLLINGPSQYTALATLSARSLIQCGTLCDPVPACGGVVYGQTGLTSCVLASLPTATTEPTAEPECLTGWTRESSSCYRVFNISKLWQNAETSCKTEASGAHLVSISSEEENLFVRNLAQGPTSPATAVQIGLRHYSDEGVDAQGMPVFRWIDGTPFVFQKWSPDQPNVVSSENIGTNLFLSSSEWNDFGFDQFPNPYVCEYKLQ